MIHLSETDSTSNYLNALSAKQPLEEFTVVTADYQISGKGQRGNSWESARGENLLFSFILYPSFLEVRYQFILSQIVSLAVKETLDTYDKDFSIKWPNDIYWKDKKICGILLENDLLGSSFQKSIAGVGINVNQKTFISDAPNPVSLWQITGEEHSISLVLTNVMVKVNCYYNLLKEGKTDLIINHYHDSLYRKEGFYTYQDNAGKFKARMVEVEPTGTLILEDTTGKKRNYLFKEVQYVLPE